jgi:hypothetical protein
LTNFTELIPSSKIAGYAATQDLPNILQNMKVYYCVHMTPPLVSIISRINPVHTPHPLSPNPL